MNHTVALKNLLQDSIEKDLFFAMYRLPNEVEPHLILQNDPIILSPSESPNNNEGFIMSGFNTNTPVVWIKKDIHIYDFSKALPNIDAVSYNRKFEHEGSEEISEEDYTKNLEELLIDINQGRAEKVVYSRTVHADLDQSAISDAYLNLLSLHTDALVFLVHLPGGITWIGASPEVLLSEDNLIGKSMALAATRKIDDDEDWNEKEIDEQAYVTDYLDGILRSLDVSFEKGKRYSRKLRSGLMHLCTDFSFKLNERTQLIEILKRFHPTPAVCGIPREEAYELIDKFEIHKREYYTGYLGPININKSSHLYVNLRSAKCFDGKACLYVGGGITSASVSKSEWEETKLKSETILKALK